MIRDIEYELKLMLTKMEYYALLLHEGDEAFTQINHYFDTLDLDLYKRWIVVRIREKAGSFELTVKTKNAGEGAEGVLVMEEKNLPLDCETALKLISGESDINAYLPFVKEIKGKHLRYIDKITTVRKRIRINGKLPMAELDKSVYDGITDFELEWEISEGEYEQAVACLEVSGISIRGRKSGLSKYGRLAGRLIKGKA